jgi:putative membrane protein
MSYALRTVAAVTVAATGLLSSGAAATAPGTIDRITNRETVQADLHSDGTVKVARLFSQLVVDGTGTVHVVDPSATKNLRDLDGFAKPSTSNGSAVWDIDVNGRAVRRTVADYNRALPVSVRVTYELDGKPVKPGRLVGRSGLLKTTYHVKNETSEPTEVTYTDGNGKRQTATVSVPTPFVGQLQTTLPARFTGLDAPRADIAGDGRGGNLLTWTMVLFSPIGEIEQEFGWTARIRNGIAPKASVQIVPVPPKRKPELKFGEDGFSGGAAQASELTKGAGQIDSHVLELRDGAATLLDGLSKLAAGATTLKAGLAGQAAPGAAQLAGGLDQAAAGGGALATGLGALNDGAGKIAGGLHSASDGGQQLLTGSQDLAAGAGLVSTGAQQVADGLVLVGNGLTSLSTAVSGLSTNPGYLALKAGIAAIGAGLGSAASPLTILGALNAVELGLTQLGTSHSAGLPAVADGVGTLKAGLLNAKSAIATMAAAMTGQQAYLAGVAALSGCPAATPVCVNLANAQGIAAAVKDGLTNADPALGLGAGVDAALAGIGDSATPGATVLYGLAAAIAGIGSTATPGSTLLYGLHQAILGLDHPVGAAGPSDKGGVKQGVAAVGVGLDQLVAGIIAAVNGALGQPADAPTASLRGAVAALTGGADQVADGTKKVADGSGTLSAGALTLADGLGQLDTGAATLAGGTGQAQGGADALLDGLDQLKAGAHQLSSGLGTAAGGAGQLADGLGQAKGGGQQLTDGAGRLSREGTSVLVTKGNKTAADSALSYARLAKLDEKAASGALPYGAPEGASGSAAYLLTVAAADAQGTEDNGRLAIAIGMIVLASVAGGALRRRGRGAPHAPAQAA